MLEYVIDFIEKNILFILIAVIAITFFSMYFKTAKKAFAGLFFAGCVYIVVLYLGKNGIGSEAFLSFSKKYILGVLYFLDRALSFIRIDEVYFLRNNILYSTDFIQQIEFLGVIILTVCLLRYMFVKVKVTKFYYNRVLVTDNKENKSASYIAIVNKQDASIFESRLRC